MSACPFCKNRGRVMVGEDSDMPDGLVCLNCNGTGDYETMKLIRACRLGEYNGEQRAIARASSANLDPGAVKQLGWDTIASAVIDDIRRLRHEEMLDPHSREFKRIEAELERLHREREPVLQSLGAMAAELREELASYG